jgi:hypothetical protein
MRTLLIALPVLVLSACSYSSGPEETRTFNLADFDSIQASDGVDVQLRQGPFSVTAIGSAGALDRLNVERDGSVLRVANKRGVSLSFGSSAHIVVTAPTFASITAGGGADIEGDSLRLEAVSVRSGGGADIDLSGTCATLTAEASGGGDIDAGELVCSSVRAEASGGGDAIVHATESVEASASGGGDITIRGAPPRINQSASGGGDINVE